MYTYIYMYVCITIRTMTSTKKTLFKNFACLKDMLNFTIPLSA